MTRANSTLIGGSVGKGGLNKKNDVRAVQTLLNLPANMSLSGLKASLDTADGKLDEATQEAINSYQKNVMNRGKKDQTIDGRVDRSGGMIHRLAQALPALPSFPYSSPKWLKIATDEEDKGVKEEGTLAKNHPQIIKYLESFSYLAKHDYEIPKKDAEGKVMKTAKGNVIKESSGYKMSQVDETAWCACFVNWCLLEAGEAKGKGALARSWQSYGKGGDALIGNICVIEREPFGDSGTGWHVGFFLAGDPRAGYVALLGGNQGNSVCRRWFVGLKNCYQRWPG
jgi:uncharacterized protein (TIGR02594 family)